MFIKSDSNFSIFISDLRKLEGRERDIKVLSERRNILNCTNKNLEESNVLKMMYFAINSQDFDIMQFIKSIGSEDLKTKKYAYQGLLLTTEEEYLILTFNTLMKDLRDKKTREIALNFLCNVNLKSNIYEDLAGFICTKNITDKNKLKSIIAKSKISPLERISLVGSNENLIFGKVQIILECLLNDRPVDLVENDTLFLTSFYGTTSNSFLKVKLLQLYKILNEQGRIHLTKSFFLCIEKDIILPHEVIKPLVDISLSIEILDLLMSTSHSSQKTDSFLYRLIDSQNSNSRFMGFKLAMKHKAFGTQVIDKAIKSGLHNNICLEALMFFINKSTYKDIYKRKEEMRYIMDKHNIKESISDEIITSVLHKIVEYSKDDLYLKIYYENPHLCTTKQIDRNISEELKMIYFNKLKSKNRMKYFCLLYEMVPQNYRDKEFYKEMFQNHISIILKSRSTKGLVPLERLILLFLSFDDLEFFRDVLVSRYFSVSKDYQQVLSDGIYLMNAKCKEKIIIFEDGTYLKYSLTLDRLKIKNKGGINSLEVRNGGENTKRTSMCADGLYNLQEYELCTSRDVEIILNTGKKTFIKKLFPLM